MNRLALLERSIIFVLLIVMVIFFAVSFMFPVFYTMLAINFFLLLVFVLFLLMYFDRGTLGNAVVAKRYPSLTVLIPVYNSMNTIKACLYSVKKIKYPGRMEILVIDDCCTDGTSEYMKTVKGITLFRQPHNSGKATAMNTGLKKVKTELVACIDSDTYPDADIFVKSVGYFDDKDVGAVSCLILPDKKKSLIQRIQFFEYASGFGLWTTVLASINAMSMIPGPMTIFRKKFFDEAGGYDKDNLTEDMEIGMRLQKHGYKIRTCFEAVAYTDVPDTWKKLFKQRDRWYRGRIYNLMLYKKLFFNRKNPNLGFFALPYIFALELASVVLLARILIMGINNFSNFVIVEGSIIATTGSLGILIPKLFLTSTMIFFFVSYIFIFLFYFYSLRIIHYTPKGLDFLAILINIILYPFFVTVVYLQGMIKEMFGAEAKWERVST